MQDAAMQNVSDKQAIHDLRVFYSRSIDHGHYDKIREEGTSGPQAIVASDRRGDCGTNALFFLFLRIIHPIRLRATKWLRL